MTHPNQNQNQTEHSSIVANRDTQLYSNTAGYTTNDYLNLELDLKSKLHEANLELKITKDALHSMNGLTESFENTIAEKDNIIAEQDKSIKTQIDKIDKLTALLKEANLYVNSEIPNSFEVLMQKYNVIGKQGDSSNCHGTANCATSEIILYSAVSNVPQNQNQLELTFYHELAHVILNSIGENELFENERLTEMLGRAIYSFLKTRKYDTQPKDRE